MDGLLKYVQCSFYLLKEQQKLDASNLDPNYNVEFYADNTGAIILLPVVLTNTDDNFNN